MTEQGHPPPPPLPPQQGGQRWQLQESATVSLAEGAKHRGGALQSWYSYLGGRRAACLGPDLPSRGASWLLTLSLGSQGGVKRVLQELEKLQTGVSCCSSLALPGAGGKNSGGMVLTETGSLQEADGEQTGKSKPALRLRSVGAFLRPLSP